MKQLVSLLRAAMTQDMSLFRFKTKGKSKVSQTFLGFLLSIAVMFSVGAYAKMLTDFLAPMNLTYIMLTMFVLLTTVLTLIEGMYKSQGILFEAKDSDLLFSLPISKRKIFFTRLFKLITFEFLYNLLFMLPAVVVYAMHETVGIDFYFISMLMLILLPIIPTIIGSILGYVIKAASSKAKAKKTVQTLFSIGILLLVFYFSFNIQDIVQKLANNAQSINDIIVKIYYPAGLYVNLIQDFEILNLITLIAINVIPAIIFIFLASILYFRIISNLSEKGARLSIRKKLKSETIKIRTPIKALIKKELKRFFSSPVFIINSGFGIVLILVATIAMVVNFEGAINSFITYSGDMETNLSQIESMLPQMFYGIIVLFSSMTVITCSMISLEGKSFNVTKSLPIEEEKILLSKILTSNILTVPVIILSDIMFFLRFKLDYIYIIDILLISIVMPTFTALIGLVINLKYPKMNASSDAEVVKQSMSSLICVLLGMVIGFGTFMAIFMVNNAKLFIAIEIITVTVLSMGLWQVLKTYGKKKFREINV